MVFLFKQKTAYEMRISDWSSDVCSSDLHGKTALLHALTGQQGDRRREERERGITIDLGYLYADLGEGSLTGFIDVPGHERFVHNMLAGASGIDCVLLVVAADDGVMPPRSEEHTSELQSLMPHSYDVH